MDKVIFTARIDKDLAEWFSANFPARGSQQWFLEGCISKLKEMHDSGEYETPVDLLDLAVREVTK